jgi:hypothetical protein
MVSKRSKKTSYSIDFPDGPRPVKRNERPISKYYAQLDGGEKSVLLIKPIQSNQQTGVRF